MTEDRDFVVERCQQLLGAKAMSDPELTELGMWRVAANRLIAENKELHVDNKRLRAELDLIRADRDVWRKAYAAVEADNARLRAEHRHILGMAKQAEVYHSRLGASEVFIKIADAARRALESKP